MPDVDVRCKVCEGQRFNPETLRVTWHGYHAGALLDLEIDAACEASAAVPRIAQPLQWMRDLGLGYLRRGQPSNTLSGGEAQRRKPVAEIASITGQGRSLYVLDELSTGLHKGDVARLARMLKRFVERGDTVLLIEHQPDLIHSSDWLIEPRPRSRPQRRRSGGQRHSRRAHPPTLEPYRPHAETIAGYIDLFKGIRSRCALNCGAATTRSAKQLPHGKLTSVVRRLCAALGGD